MDPSPYFHTLYPRTGGSSSGSEDRPPVFKAVGIALAIASGLFIGVSFVLKKHGLLKANVKYNEEAGEGYGYLKNVWWWSGMTLMIIGEVCNFVAYAFVDAILVTPLGALSVVVTTILSAIFLKERLSFVGKVGCFACIIGSIVIVLNAPEQSAVANIQDMQDLVVTPGFLSYAGVIIVGCAIVAFYVGPRYGKKSMMVYLTICSMIGGLSVVATQGLGASIIAQIGGKSQFTEPFLYILLVFVIATLVTEIIYLNKALNLFNAALVTPTYYVFFTSSTIVTSAILFQGFKGTPTSIATVIMGFLQICAGVVLLQLSKSSKDVPDAAVFSGDLDQARVIAEQEEPEYEPRADTIRGGASLLRSFSKQRSRRQTLEVKKLQEEHMQPIGENEKVEFDGIRRRKTVVADPNGDGNGSGRLGVRIPMSPMRGSHLHPPLGMSQFPEDEPDSQSINSEEDTHPGFFARMRSPSKKSWLPSPVRRQQSHAEAHAQLSGQEYLAPPMPMKLQSAPPTQQDFHYDPDSQQAVTGDGAQGGRPPRKLPPLPHSARRQFSFQNVFRRRSTDDSGESPMGSRQPTATGTGPGRLGFLSRGASDRSIVSSHRYGNNSTEEENLGLVKGDSVAARSGDDVRTSDYSDRKEVAGGSDPPAYEDDDGYLVPRLAPLSGSEKSFKAADDDEDDDFDNYDDSQKGKGWRRTQRDDR